MSSCSLLQRWGCGFLHFRVVGHYRVIKAILKLNFILTQCLVRCWYFILEFIYNKEYIRAILVYLIALCSQSTNSITVIVILYSINKCCLSRKMKRHLWLKLMALNTTFLNANNWFSFTLKPNTNNWPKQFFTCGWDWDKRSLTHNLVHILVFLSLWGPCISIAN